MRNSGSACLLPHSPPPPPSASSPEGEQHREKKSETLIRHVDIRKNSFGRKMRGKVALVAGKEHKKVNKSNMFMGCHVWVSI